MVLLVGRGGQAVHRGRVGRVLFSEASAAEVTWAIMKPEFTPPLFTRKAGRPDIRESISSAMRRSDSDPISAMASARLSAARPRARRGSCRRR